MDVSHKGVGHITSPRTVPSILSRKRKSNISQTLDEPDNYDMALCENRPPPAQENHSVAIYELDKHRIPLASIHPSNSDVDMEQQQNRPAKLIKTRKVKKLCLRESWIRFRKTMPLATSGQQSNSSNSPLPEVRWANRQELWNELHRKEVGIYKRLDAKAMLDKHPTLQPRMRSILLDWLIEVCEVYRLHRETFYLAIDYIDRFLTATSDVPKTQLQLVGITSLFIASKIEEIYPPKLQEFAYVTDGACSENEILQMELVILKGLNWGLTPYTPHSWMTLFAQLTSIEATLPEEELLALPKFSGVIFSRVMQLLDLCMLDINCLSFRYSLLAASALFHILGEHVAVQISGYSWEELAQCVHWMAPFALVLQKSEPLRTNLVNSVPVNSLHNIQLHNIDLRLLDLVCSHQAVAKNLYNSMHPVPLLPVELSCLDVSSDQEDDSICQQYCSNQIPQATEPPVFLSPLNNVENW